MLWRKYGALLVLLVSVLISPPMVSTVWPALDRAGTLVYLEGQVSVRAAETEIWQVAAVNQELYGGDSVKTGPASRAKIFCLDESQIQLNENTQVILRHIAPSIRLVRMDEKKPESRYEVPNGEIWLRNNNEKFRFELVTPVVNFTPRGTEFNLQVSPQGATAILLAGSLCLTNPYGEVCLRPGEIGEALPGQAPTKRVLLRPEDAVQWTLYYPGIFSYRDLPLSAMAPAPFEEPTALAVALRQAEAAYDRGRLDEARQTAESVLQQDPHNARALTLLGWISLQHYNPEEAKAYFQRVSKPSEAAVIGLALANYRLGDSANAYKRIMAASRKLPSTAVLATMTGYFTLMVGKVDEARNRLESAARAYPEAVLPRSLLAQIYVVQNKKGAARREASLALALARAPDSPLAQFTMGLVEIASFQLDAARRHLKKAIQADPRFIAAHLYLAKTWLGSDFLNRAQRTIDAALRLAPKDPELLSLGGFIRLAFRDFRGAQKLWQAAIAADPGLGQPHLGLAIYHFRYRNFRQGLTEMLTATLLDPRVSLFQSQLGKALYQVRSFEKALEVWDHAKTLDPRDPTPHFFKGVALTDLNRPGEAIQEINKSIELNDNVAMFRSRSLLDQDRAVRNTSLARAYQQLGLTEWAFSKAVTAVKYKPYNSSAHLFLRDTIIASRFGSAAPFLTSGLLFASQETEGLLFRVLSPANQATYRSLQFRGTEALGLTRDYAPMFEMPFARLGVSGGVGAAEGSKFRQQHQAVAYGGVPGAAFEVFGEYTDDKLGRPSDEDLSSFSGRDRFYNIEANAKWQPTVKGTLTGLFQYQDLNQTDQGTTAGVPTFGFSDNDYLRSRVYELAYYHRFNPRAAFLAYFAHKQLPLHLFNKFFDIPVSFNVLTNHTFDQEINNVQVQKHLVLPFLGRHNLIGGFDYFSANISQRFRQDLEGFGTLFQGDFRPPFWSHSFYLLDYWRVSGNLVLELGLFKSFQKDPRFGFVGTIYSSLWAPRFGVNYQFGVGNTHHVLRAVAERHLTTHLIGQPLLIPSEIASFPWAIDVSSGSEVRQAGVAWEAQWDPKTFTALRLNALRVATPTFVVDLLGIERPVWQNWRRYQASLVLNRILLPSLGLSMGVLGKRVVPDLSFGPGLQSYSEINAFIGLAYLNRKGWLARISPLLVQQFGKIPGHQADNPFVIVNLTLGREFPNKRGFSLFEVQNLFNRRPFYSLEPRRDLEFSMDRRFLFRIGLYF